MRQSPSFAKIATLLGAFALCLVLVTAAAAPPRAAAQETTSGGEQTIPEMNASESEAPELGVEAWALVDEGTGRYLAGKNPDERLPTASTAKIMAALVTLEGEENLDEEALVTKKAESFVGATYSNVGLRWGEYLSVRELLLASLVPSGTDAVYALAQHVSGTVDGFVEDMNDKANEMGLENTHFENPAGIDNPEQYSSVRDLAKMARVALDRDLFAKMVNTQVGTVTAENQTVGEREIKFFTTNELLSTYPPATGVKTGTTAEAGASLVASAEKDGESYIAVVLGAESTEARDQAAREIFEYGFDSFEREPLVRKGEAYEEAPVPYRRGESVDLVAAEKVSGLVAPSSEVERRVNANELPSEAGNGQRVGEVEVLVDGQSIGSSPLQLKEGYEEASFMQKAWYRVTGIF